MIKISLEGMSPPQLVLIRLVLGATFLLVLSAVRRVAPPRTRHAWGHIAVAAVLSNVVPFLLQSYGEQTVNAAVAGVLLATIPLFTMALATAVLPTEHPSRRKAVGLLIGLLGVVVTISPGGRGLGSAGGVMACLGAALAVGSGFVYARRFLSPLGLPPVALAGAQLTVAAGVQAALMPLFGWPPLQLDGRVAASIAVLGLAGTGLAYVLYFGLIAGVGATAASSVSYVVPVFAVLVSAVLLGESVTTSLLLGGATVLTGLAYAEGRLGRRAPATRPTVAAPGRAEGCRCDC